MYVLAPNQIVAKFPYSIGDLKKDNPQTSFPKNPPDELLAAYSVFLVVSTGAQYDPATQVATQEGCSYNADKQRWETSWVVRSKSADELHADGLWFQLSIADATQKRLDDFARARNYDSILSACTYATSAVPQFAAEGQIAVDARDATWMSLYTLLAEIQAGTRDAPTSFEDIELLLPELTW